MPASLTASYGVEMNDPPWTLADLAGPGAGAGLTAIGAAVVAGYWKWRAAKATAPPKRLHELESTEAIEIASRVFGSLIDDLRQDSKILRDNLLAQETKIVLLEGRVDENSRRARESDSRAEMAGAAASVARRRGLMADERCQRNIAKLRAKFDECCAILTRLGVAAPEDPVLETSE